MPATLESRRFGSVLVQGDEVLAFPEGIPGFEDLREYLLLSPPDFAPLKFLVALRDPEISFLVLQPHTCLPGYTPALEAAHLRGLEAADPADMAIYAILTFHPEREEVTANLRAPILINPAARLGRQVILTDSKYALHHPLLGS